MKERITSLYTRVLEWRRDLRGTRCSEDVACGTGPQARGKIALLPSVTDSGLKGSQKVEAGESAHNRGVQGYLIQ